MTYLANFIYLYDKVIHLVDEGNAVDVIFLDFNKTFDTYRNLLNKLSYSEMEKYMVCCVKNCVNHRAQSVVANRGASSWRSAVFPRAQF